MSIEDAVIYFETNKKIAEICGLNNKAATYAANRATLKHTGIDFLSDLEIFSKNKTKSVYVMTLTSIARELVNRKILRCYNNSTINDILEHLGFQKKNNDKWRLINDGIKYGIRRKDDSRDNDVNTNFPIMWSSTLVDRLIDEETKTKLNLKVF